MSRLKDISTQLSICENELLQLKVQLTKLIEIEPQKDKTHHHEHELKHEPGHEYKHEHGHDLKTTLSVLDESKAAIEHINRDIEQHTLKIQALLIQKNDTQKTMGEIEVRARKRLTSQLERNTREQARIGYNTTEQGLRETLSHENWSHLLESIQNQHKALEIKCAELIKETEKINYIYFFEQLPHHLDHFSRPHSEIEALGAVIKLMKQHLQHEQESTNTKESLNKKKDSIADQRSKLEKLNSKIISLREDNPHLTANNQYLINRNAELAVSLEQNTNLRQRLVTPALLLFALTFVFTIPLILVLNGVIPFFTTPVLLFTLFAGPPAVLLIATLITGISAAVYAYKAYSNETEINANQQTVGNNNSQMGKNTQQLHTLQTITIPELEMQIKNDELIRDRLIETLRKSEPLAKQTLKQANGIEPVSFTSSPLLSRSKKGDRHQYEGLNSSPTSDESAAVFTLN